MSTVRAFNLRLGVVLTDCGNVVQIEYYLDAEGEEIEDRAKAAVALAPMPDGTWAVVALRETAPHTAH